MKKFLIIFILIVTIIALLILYCNYFNDKSSFPFQTQSQSQSNSPTGTKISANITSDNSTNSIEKGIFDDSNNFENLENPENITKEISTFTTEIKDKSPGRLTNIKITCNKLNNYIIKPFETFSFNEVVGQPSTKEGYQEATVIINNKLTQGIGGGNCQVSSTLYNAALLTPSIEIVERHEHGLEVTYVQKGKDAAVSYGSLDLKFKNNSNKPMKITLETDDSTLTTKIFTTNN